jgi:hypothetical protein
VRLSAVRLLAVGSVSADEVAVCFVGFGFLAVAFVGLGCFVPFRMCLCFVRYRLGVRLHFVWFRFVGVFRFRLVRVF